MEENEIDSDAKYNKMMKYLIFLPNGEVCRDHCHSDLYFPLSPAEDKFLRYFRIIGIIHVTSFLYIDRAVVGNLYEVKSGNDPPCFPRLCSPFLLTFLALAPLYGTALFCSDDDKPRLASRTARYFYRVVPTPARR